MDQLIVILFVAILISIIFGSILKGAIRLISYVLLGIFVALMAVWSSGDSAATSNISDRGLFSRDPLVAQAGFSDAMPDRDAVISSASGTSANGTGTPPPSPGGSGSPGTAGGGTGTPSGSGGRPDGSGSSDQPSSVRAWW